MWVAKQGARVGAAAFALGLALAGPGVAAATTDGTDTGAATAPETQSQPTAPTAPAAKSTATRPRRGAAPAETAARATPAAAAAGRTAARTASKPAPARRVNRGIPTAATPVSPTGNDPVATPVAGSAPNPAAIAPDQTVAPVTSVTSATPAADVTVSPSRAVANPVAALSIAGAAATAAATDPLSALFGPIGSFIEGIGLLIRRTFFNQAPTVTPVQLTGQLEGPVTGTVGAVDPEGDPIVYSITGQPLHGSITLGSDGSYTYTPGAGFTGRDSFTVAATDTGFHLNLLDLFRPASTEAYMQVTQGATQSLLTFTFIYGSGSQYWSQAARAALQASAEQLADYLVVTTPVNVTFDVTAESSPLSGTLASAGSDLTSSDPGFYDTVVQQKILTGVDANGAAADGTIDWNFGQPWAYGSSVSYSQYDFTSTAMHELMHTLGFLSNVDEPGWNSQNENWLTFDKYMVTADGTAVIGSNYRWNPSYNTNLTGGNGGLYFGGPTAVSIYGGPVPLYTPNPWEPGSSVSHLDDDTFTGRNSQLMNAISDTGNGIRVLSPIELAILQDIGYTVNSNPVSAAVFLIGFGFIRRRRGNR